MMLTVFQSDKGDCLLLTGPGGERMLIDGGMAKSFREHAAPALGRLAAAGHALDLVYVSHIDQDHIGGILQLMDNLVEWRRYDYRKQAGVPNLKPPKVPRPPEVRAVWHNVFKDTVDDNDGAIQDQLVANVQLANMNPELLDARVAAEAAGLSELVTSIREGLALGLRLGRRLLNIPVNQEFGGKVICLDSQPVAHTLGSLTLRVLGPAQADLDKLRADWNKWLKANRKAVEEVRQEAEEMAEQLPITEGQLVMSSLLALAAKLGDRNLVTPPNLASLMLLAEGGGKRVLLTGDGHADDVIKGLRVNGCLDAEGRLHVDVLKVQHHGSEHNLTEAFARDITADHYVFCGNGSDENPNPHVVQAIIDARLAAASGPAARPFKLWFNSSHQVSEGDRARHMRALHTQVERAARRSHGRLRYRFLTRGSKFDIRL